LESTRAFARIVTPYKGEDAAVPKPISWSYRLHEIRDRANGSKRELWSRQDIEELFEVKRVAAQRLMQTIGDLQTIGGKHFVERASLLEFLDQSVKTDNLSAMVQEARLEAGPPPKPQSLPAILPAELRSVMSPDLERNGIEIGRDGDQAYVKITGKDSIEIFERSLIYAQACKNDLGRIQDALDPVPAPPPIEDEELRSFLHRFQRRVQV
jgi:hypothetical protein